MVKEVQAKGTDLKDVCTARLRITYARVIARVIHAHAIAPVRAQSAMSKRREIVSTSREYAIVGTCQVNILFVRNRSAKVIFTRSFQPA